MGEYDTLHAEKRIFKNRYRMRVTKTDSPLMKILRGIGLVKTVREETKVIQTNDTKEGTKKFWENMGHEVSSIEEIS